MLQWLLEQAGNFGDLIALMTVIAGGGLWVVKMLLSGRKQVQGLFSGQEALAKTAEQLSAAVKEIGQQLKPNGGTSMFDMIASAHKQSVENRDMLSGMREALDAVRAYQWSFAETIADKPVWESDTQGNCTRINSALAKLSERTPAEFANAGWENFIDPADRSRVYDEWTDAIQRKRTFESSYIVKSRSGKRYKVNAHALPVLADGGRLVGYVGRYDEILPIA